MRFNGADVSAKNSAFNVRTSANNNTTKGQAISSCVGRGTADIYSARDRSEDFLAFPVAGHAGEPLSVEEFINRY